MKSRRRASSRQKKKTRQAAPSTPAAAGGISIAAFARLVGVDEKAVRKGIDSGRLSSAVVGRSASGARATIADPEAARLEWLENAGQAREVAAPPAAAAAGVAAPAPAAVEGSDLAARLAAARAQRAAAAAAAPAPTPGAAAPASVKAGTLMEAQRAVTLERGRRLRLENDLRAGELVEVAVVAREAFEASRILREAILNLPARISGELASVTDPALVYSRLDTELRAILTSTARELAGDHDAEKEGGSRG